MKEVFITGLFFITLLSATQAQYRTERTGYEGDYFSLEGAIELFKQAHSLQDFERRINSKTTYVNNLDLNYDGRIDYIRVEHRRQGDFHAIILQVPIDKYDLQDVAVIEIEKIGRRDAVLQIIGDEDLYGEQVIVEPFVGDRYASTRGRSSSNYVSNDYVNVYYWPAVQSILDSRYRVYVSPYRWSYYPTWWRPWRPYSWNVYHPRIRNYYRYCHVVNVYRAPRVHRFYHTHRAHSRHVAQRAAKIRQQHAGSHDHPGTIRRPRAHGEMYGAPRAVERDNSRVPRKRLSQEVSRSSSSIKTHRNPSSNHKQRVVSPVKDRPNTTGTHANDHRVIRSGSSSKSQIQREGGSRSVRSSHSRTADQKRSYIRQGSNSQISHRQSSHHKPAANVKRSSSVAKRMHVGSAKAKNNTDSTRKKGTTPPNRNR